MPGDMLKQEAKK